MSNGNNPSKGLRSQPNPRTNGKGVSRRPWDSNREPFQWSDIDPKLIGEFVQAVTRGGNAVICGVTSDGGALSVTILVGEDRIRDWPANAGDFERLSAWAHDSFTLD